MRRIALTLLALSALTATATYADAVKDFKKGWLEKRNSWERIALIKALDPGEKKQLGLLCDFVLKKQDWYYREAAIDVLAGVTDPDLIKQLEREAKDAVICEGVLMAYGQSGNSERIPWMIEQLENKKWVAKRAAAIALSKIPDKRSIDPLISAWENEDKFMVWVHILETLERLTREKNMPRAEDWRGWWEAVKDHWELPTGDVDEGELGGGEINKTRVRGTDLEFRSRGKGLPLLVLPDYGYEKDYLETYLRNLEDTNQIIYMKLPGATDFKDPPLPNAPGLPSPWYPIDRIVETFEALHGELIEQNKIEKKPFAILAHGLTCWISMRFAEKNPRAVRLQMLVAPVSGNKAWSDGRQRVEDTGKQTNDIEMEHYAMSQSFEGGKARYEATQGPEEEEALQRKGHTLYFADQRDLEIGRIYGPIVEKQVDERSIARVHAAFRPMGSIFIPEFSLFKLGRTQTPTLIMYGAHSIRTTLDDCNAIAKHYRNAKVFPFKRSSRMPFIEENEKFVETVRKFLGGGRR